MKDARNYNRVAVWPKPHPERAVHPWCFPTHRPPGNWLALT